MANENEQQQEENAEHEPFEAPEHFGPIAQCAEDLAAMLRDPSPTDPKWAKNLLRSGKMLQASLGSLTGIDPQVASFASYFGQSVKVQLAESMLQLKATMVSEELPLFEPLLNENGAGIVTDVLNGYTTIQPAPCGKRLAIFQQLELPDGEVLVHFVRPVDVRYITALERPRKRRIETPENRIVM